MLPPTMPCQLAYTPATHPAGMVHDAMSRSAVVCGVFGDTRHVVEFDAERIGDQPDGLAEDRGALGGHRRQFGVVDRLAEADRHLGLG